MSRADLAIVDARVVTRARIIDDAAVSIRDGRIVGVGDAVDAGRVLEARGAWLLPGFVDLHNDAIENEIEPRPHACFPLGVALRALENRLLSQGVTTIFHALAFMAGRPGSSRAHRIAETVRGISELRDSCLMRHRVHARYEIPEPGYAAPLIGLIRQGLVQMLSTMDHTPGQGQYRDASRFVDYLRQVHRMSEAEARRHVSERQARGRGADWQGPLAAVLAEARTVGLPIASHDDDCEEAVALARSRGATISEFPIALDVARAASRQGQHVVVGAPNVVLGQSNTGNMKAADAVRAGVADILCSDYHAPSLLPAVFALGAELGMAQAVALVSAAPAAAVGLDSELGSVEPGKRADLVLAREDGAGCVVEATLVAGRMVYARSIGSESMTAQRPPRRAVAVGEGVC